MQSNRLATAGFVIGVFLLLLSCVPGFGPQDTLFEQSQYTLPDPTIAVLHVEPNPAHAADLDPTAFPHELQPVPPETPEDKRQSRFDLSDLPVGWYNLTIQHPDEAGHSQAGHTRVLQILPKGYGFMAAIGALLAILAAPGVFIRSTRLWTDADPGVNLTGWKYLLMENSGLSLARLQLVIFFVPTAVVYLTLAFPLHKFPAVPASIWELLGIGGATAALSSIITPTTDPDSRPADSDPRTVVKSPRISDLFEDGSGFGDISRYQSLVICLSTAVVFLAAFFDNWQVPAIPDKVLGLLGTSLAVYLGVKGVKVVKDGAKAN